MKVFIICIALLLTACEEYPKYQTFERTGNDCQQDTVEKRATFTLECIKGANPKSDEEPEDWIRICKSMAEETFCEEKIKRITEVKKCSDCFWLRVTEKEVNDGNYP